MIIKLNGKKEDINEKTSLAGLVQEKGLEERRIAVELNLDIVSREKWPQIILSEGDSVEIISFMAGGSL